MKWNVTLPVYASMFVEVEADDEKSAIEAAYQKAGYPSGLCHQCSREIELGEFCEDGAAADQVE